MGWILAERNKDEGKEFISHSHVAVGWITDTAVQEKNLLVSLGIDKQVGRWWVCSVVVVLEFAFQWPNFTPVNTWCSLFIQHRLSGHPCHTVKWYNLLYAQIHKYTKHCFLFITRIALATRAHSMLQGPELCFALPRAAPSTHNHLSCRNLWGTSGSCFFTLWKCSIFQMLLEGPVQRAQDNGH